MLEADIASDFSCKRTFCGWLVVIKFYACFAPAFIIILNDSLVKYHSDEFVFFLQREPWVKHAIKKRRAL